MCNWSAAGGEEGPGLTIADTQKMHSGFTLAFLYENRIRFCDQKKAII